MRLPGLPTEICGYHWGCTPIGMRYAFLLLLLAAACGGDLQNRPPGPAPLQTPANQQPLQQESVAKEATGSLILSPLSDSEKGPVDEDGSRRIGTHRALSRPLPGKWMRDGGEAAVWRLEIQSPGAVALRLHFTEFHLDHGTLLLVQPEAEPSPSSERRYQGYGPAGDGEFWSDLVEGDTVVVEYHPTVSAPAGDELPFLIEEISHLWQSPLDAF